MVASGLQGDILVRASMDGRLTLWCSSQRGAWSYCPEPGLVASDTASVGTVRGSGCQHSEGVSNDGYEQPGTDLSIFTEATVSNISQVSVSIPSNVPVFDMASNCSDGDTGEPGDEEIDASDETDAFERMEALGGVKCLELVACQQEGVVSNIP